MTTFSQLVDAMVVETRRPDLLNDIISYLNQTLREVHFTADKNQAILYRDNLREQLLVANSDTGFGFDIPDITTFQAMQAVRYDSKGGCYPPERVPGRGLLNVSEFFYRAGSRYNFAGYGGSNALIAIAYYAYPTRLVYYPVAQRPGQYSPDGGWTYATAFNGSVELRLAAQGYTTNWILMRWVDVISEGLRAKVYKRIADTDRARTCYSLYLALRAGLYSSEVADLAGHG